MDVIAIVIQVGVVVTPLLVFVYLMRTALHMYGDTTYMTEAGVNFKEVLAYKLVSVALFVFSFAYVLDIVLKFRASV